MRRSGPGDAEPPPVPSDKNPVSDSPSWDDGVPVSRQSRTKRESPSVVTENREVGEAE